MSRRILYTGIEPDRAYEGEEIFHMPLLEMEMRSCSNKETQNVFTHLADYSHLLFTSKYSVQAFFSHLKELGISKDYLKNHFILAIGTSTYKALESEGIYINYMGNDETEIGMVRLLENIDLSDSSILIPQSCVTSPKLVHYLIEKSISYEVVILYDILKKKPYFHMDLSNFDLLVFTSPVAVDRFFELYKDIPVNIDIECLGVMTRCHLKHHLDTIGKQIDKKILL